MENINIFEQDRAGNTPLHRAIKERNIPIIQELIQRPALSNEMVKMLSLPGENGNTVLHLVLNYYSNEHIHAEICHLIFDKLNDITDEQLKTILTIQNKSGHIALYQLIIGNNGYHNLYSFLQNISSSPRLLKIFLTLQDKNKQNIFHWIAEDDDLQMLKNVVFKYLDMQLVIEIETSKDIYGQTPFDINTSFGLEFNKRRAIILDSEIVVKGPFNEQTIQENYKIFLAQHAWLSWRYTVDAMSNVVPLSLNSAESTISTPELDVSNQASGLHFSKQAIPAIDSTRETITIASSKIASIPPSLVQVSSKKPIYLADQELNAGQLAREDMGFILLSKEVFSSTDDMIDARYYTLDQISEPTISPPMSPLPSKQTNSNINLQTKGANLSTQNSDNQTPDKNNKVENKAVTKPLEVNEQEFIIKQGYNRGLLDSAYIAKAMANEYGYDIKCFWNNVMPTQLDSSSIQQVLDTLSEIAGLPPKTVIPSTIVNIAASGTQFAITKNYYYIYEALQIEASWRVSDYFADSNLATIAMPIMFTISSSALLAQGGYPKMAYLGLGMQLAYATVSAIAVTMPSSTLWQNAQNLGQYLIGTSISINKFLCGMTYNSNPVVHIIVGLEVIHLANSAMAKSFYDTIFFQKDVVNSSIVRLKEHTPLVQSIFVDDSDVQEGSANTISPLTINSSVELAALNNSAYDNELIQ